MNGVQRYMGQRGPVIEGGGSSSGRLVDCLRFRFQYSHQACFLNHLYFRFQSPLFDFTSTLALAWRTIISLDLKPLGTVPASGRDVLSN